MVKKLNSFMAVVWWVASLLVGIAALDVGLEQLFDFGIIAWIVSITPALLGSGLNVLVGIFGVLFLIGLIFVKAMRR